MKYEELYRRAKSKNGLSANFTGNQTKNTTKMATANKLFANKTFGFQIKNESAEDITYALMDGSMDTLEEIKKRYPHVKALLADGEFFTGTDTKKATCTCKGDGSIKYFQKYFSSVPAQASTLDMVSSDKENFYTDIEIGTPNPCGIEQLQRKALSDYLGTQQYAQNRTIARNINIPLSAAHIVLLTVKANSTVVMTFTVSALI